MGQTRTLTLAVALSLVAGVVIGLSLGVGQAVGTSWLRGNGAARAQGGTADSDDRMIAVTGSVGSGNSVLWLVDTEAKRISVYRSENGKNLVWVAGRNIAWDFKIEGYHDESVLSAEELRRRWEQHALRREPDKPKGAGGTETTPGAQPGEGKDDR